MRPYPAAGGLYALDLYLIVNRCAGLDAGLYAYDAERHALRSRPVSQHHTDALLADASLATAIPQEQLQVLVIVAAHFQRVAWKYSSIAYSLVLKDVGVLYDTMYLAATAMGLAPCAVGCGNADLFARCRRPRLLRRHIGGRIPARKPRQAMNVSCRTNREKPYARR